MNKLKNKVKNKLEMNEPISKWLAEIKNPHCVRYNGKIFPRDDVKYRTWQECYDQICKAYEDRESRAVELLKEIKELLEFTGPAKTANKRYDKWFKEVEELLEA